MSIVVVNTEHSSTVLGNIDENCVQQAAVDLRLDKVWYMYGDFVIDEEGKQHRITRPMEVDAEGYYYLTEGSYEVSSSHIITIGPDEAGFVITRSTLNRNGCFITSGLYDPGYCGEMAMCLHVTGGPMRIKPGTRIGQYISWKVANAQGLYKGSYGYEDGKPKAEQVKYATV